MSYTIQYAYFSIPGKVRGNHEDNLYIDRTVLPLENTGTNGVINGFLLSDTHPLIGVFDGMGGESSGEVASFIAADTIRRIDTDRTAGTTYCMGTGCSSDTLQQNDMDDSGQGIKQDDLREPGTLCLEMNREVCSYAKEKRIRSMGTTAVCLRFSDQEAQFANVGDSRIYHIGKDGICRITEDQVMKSIFYAKPPLTQYLGMEDEEMALLPQTGKIPVNIGDRFLLCTDGVTDMLSDEDISEIIKSEENSAACLEKLMQSILLTEAKDNATAVLCSISMSSAN